MKIALLIPSRANRGPVVFTKNLIEGLLQQGCNCEVFYFHLAPDELEFPVRQTRLRLFRSCDFTGFDVVHSTGAICDAYIALHQRAISPPTVCGIHNFFKADIGQLYSGVKAKIYTLVWKWSLRRIKNFIVSSQTMQHYYVDLLGKNARVYVIPYGIPKPETTPIDSSTAEELIRLRSQYKILVGCGLLIKRKGFHQLIELLSERPDVAVVLIGNGEKQEELQLLAVKLNVEDRVLFLGFRPNSANYYPYCDAYVMCSNSEGFGLAMLEALALGIPVVCTDLPIYKDYFSAKDVALFQYDNKSSLSKAISQVLTHNQAYQQSSRTLFESWFSLNKMAESHIQLYANLTTQSNDGEI